MPTGIYKRKSSGMKGKHHSDETKRKIGEANKGKIISLETIKKMRDRMTGTKLSEEIKRKISEALVGRKLSEETKQRMSEAQKRMMTPEKREKLREFAKKNHFEKRFGDNDYKGDKSPSWKGGITPQNRIIRASIEYRLWREAVFARDNYTCQSCGERGRILHSHHNKNFADYPELRTSIENGTTLCRECHIEFHKEYGKRNNTKEQLDEFLSKGRDVLREYLTDKLDNIPVKNAL